MKLQKNVMLLATLSLLGLSVSCNKKYREGLEAGKAEGYVLGYDDGYADGDYDGYNQGYADGDADGYDRGWSTAQEYFASADYQNGYNTGLAQGQVIGYNQGYAVGQTAGYNTGFSNGSTSGYNTGYNDGYSDGEYDGYYWGYDDGYDDGFADGNSPANATIAYNNGYNAGEIVGYNNGYNDGYTDGDAFGYADGLSEGYWWGYDDGFLDGYDVGFDDGWDAAFGFSTSARIGKIPAQKQVGGARVLAMVHNDLFNYKSIAAPKVTSKGISANGRMIFDETSQTVKDLQKRAAAVERYLVNEMSKQVEAQFKLSADRSLQIAKASNHLRKFATLRALTQADSNAYAEEMIGVNFKDLEKAVKSSMTGSKQDLTSVLESAANKNGTTPEKMSEIMTSLFF